MKLTLPDGHKIDVMVKHTDETPETRLATKLGWLVLDSHKFKTSELTVGTEATEAELKMWHMLLKLEQEKRTFRKTEMAVKFDDGHVLTGSSQCSPLDVFSKTEGRRLALIRIFAHDSPERRLSGADRLFLVKVLCSSIFASKPSPKKARAAIAALVKIRDRRLAIDEGKDDVGDANMFRDWAANLAQKVLDK